MPPGIGPAHHRRRRQTCSATLRRRAHSERCRRHEIAIRTVRGSIVGYDERCPVPQSRRVFPEPWIVVIIEFLYAIAFITARISQKTTLEVMGKLEQAVRGMVQGAQISAPLGKYSSAVDVLEALGSTGAGAS